MARFDSKQTPYGGMINNKPIETGPHLMVSGMTGSGKTTRVLAPAAMFWRGPRVIVSSKTDFLRWCVQKGIARRGPLYVMDLAGELHDDFDWLHNTTYQRVHSDPTYLVHDDDTALDMATLLMKLGSLGSGSSASGGSGDDAFWKTLTVDSLATLLLAGRAEGSGIEWTLQAMRKYNRDSEDDFSPSWETAAGIVGDTSFHTESLIALLRLDDKIRDSAAATMKAGLSPWLRTTVRGRPGSEPFVPEMLESDDAEPTLAIIAPAVGVAAGAAVGALQTIVNHWRLGVERGLDRVLFAIDEAVNTSPMPDLPTYITEARGLGIACVIAVQSTKQLRIRWDEAQANTLRECTPCLLVLRGAPEFEALEAAAKWAGEQDTQRESIDAQGHRSFSQERLPKRTAMQLLPPTVNQGRLLIGGMEGKLVDLPGIWNMGPATG